VVSATGAGEVVVLLAPLTPPMLAQPLAVSITIANPLNASLSRCCGFAMLHNASAKIASPHKICNGNRFGSEGSVGQSSDLPAVAMVIVAGDSGVSVGLDIVHVALVGAPVQVSDAA